jgi:hypothetical protein
MAIHLIASAFSRQEALKRNFLGNDLEQRLDLLRPAATASKFSEIDAPRRMGGGHLLADTLGGLCLPLHDASMVLILDCDRLGLPPRFAAIHAKEPVLIIPTATIDTTWCGIEFG